MMKSLPTFDVRLCACFTQLTGQMVAGTHFTRCQVCTRNEPSAYIVGPVQHVDQSLPIATTNHEVLLLQLTKSLHHDV
eukprot:scaffold529374_cov17-Prasinocladus_malaysianus.AAC.1